MEKLTLRQIIENLRFNTTLQANESRQLELLLRCQSRADVQVLYSDNDSLYWAVKGLINLLDINV